MKKSISLLVATFLVSGMAAYAQMKFAEGTWAAVKAQAKAANKSIFVDAYTTWCGPCKMMSKQVFPLPEVGEFYNANFINYKLDMESEGDGMTFAQTYNVQAYPTMLYFSPQGELTHKIVGARDGDGLIDAGKSALDPSKQYYSLRRRFEKGERAPDFLKSYMAAAVELQDDEAVPMVAEAYMKDIPQSKWTEADVWEVLQYLNSPDGKYFAYVSQNRAKFEQALGKDRVMGYMEQGIQQKIQKVVVSKSEANLTAFKAQIVKDFPQEGKKWQALAEVMFAAEVGGDDKRTEKALDDYLSNYSDNWQQLNQMAWGYFQQKTDATALQMATKWAKRSVDLNKNFYNTDTYANLLFKLGKNQEALTWAEESVKLGKATGEDTSGTEKLLTDIKTKMGKK